MTPIQQTYQSILIQTVDQKHVASDWNVEEPNKNNSYGVIWNEVSGNVKINGSLLAFSICQNSDARTENNHFLNPKFS